jgi:hypothetical protein
MRKASEPKIDPEEEKEKERAMRRALFAERRPPLLQAIEMHVQDGVISMRVYPLAEDMLLYAARMGPETQVIRRFEFPDGVPPEYAWMNESPCITHDGIIWAQHFRTAHAWRAHVDREAAAGHFLPKEDP